MRPGRCLVAKLVIPPKISERSKDQLSKGDIPKKKVSHSTDLRFFPCVERNIRISKKQLKTGVGGETAPQSGAGFVHQLTALTSGLVLCGQGKL